MYDFNTFSLNCSQGKCLRKSMYNKKTCSRDSKQERCFEKYEKKESKSIKIDQEYNRFVVKVWDETFEEGYTGFSTRDKWENYCQLWAILSEQQRNYIKEHYQNDLWLNKNLDVAHIKAKDITPELKYSTMNGVIIGRYFHQLLDGFRDPVTREVITKEQREGWLLSAKFKLKEGEKS